MTYRCKDCNLWSINTDHVENLPDKCPVCGGQFPEALEKV